MVNNQEKGIICLIVTLLLTILTYIGLYLSGYFGEHLLDYGMWTYKYLPEKYMFYGSIISGLIGYTYLYGEPEKDFIFEIWEFRTDRFNAIQMRFGHDRHLVSRSEHVFEVDHAVIQVGGGDIVSRREHDLSFPFAESLFQNVGFQGLIFPILWRIMAKPYRRSFSVAVLAIMAAPVQAVFTAVGPFLRPEYG